MITPKQKRIERGLKRGSIVEKDGEYIHLPGIGRHSAQQTNKSGTPSKAKAKAKRKAANRSRAINRK